MSGLLFQLNKDGKEVDRKIFYNMFSKLEHRGPDKTNALFLGNAALGVHHFWTTPEEVNEIQPLKTPETDGITEEGQHDENQGGHHDSDCLLQPLFHASRHNDRRNPEKEAMPED